MKFRVSNVWANNACPAQVRAFEDATQEARLEEVRPAKVRSNEVCSLKIRSGDIRTPEVSIPKKRQPKICLRQVCPAKLCIPEVCPGKVGSVEVRPAEVRLAKACTRQACDAQIRINIGLLLPPPIPLPDPLLEDFEMFRVRHRRVTSLASGMLRMIYRGLRPALLLRRLGRFEGHTVCDRSRPVNVNRPSIWCSAIKSASRWA